MPFDRLARWIGQIFGGVRRRKNARPLIEAYAGYATPEGLVLRGRVLTRLRRNKPAPDQSLMINFLQMIALFLTDEVANVGVRSGDASTRSDAEGYITLKTPRPPDAAGWIETTLRVDEPDCEEVIASALIPAPDAPFLVISDIDDTILQTGAYSLVRNLWTSLTGNAMTRRILPDGAALMRSCAARGAPIYYVSSSPWNLHHFLERVFTLNNVPIGPMFLRDYGLARNKLTPRVHANLKSTAIDTVLAANPGLPALFVGDTGQHDAAIFAATARRHPGRVLAVALRRAGRDRLEVAEGVRALTLADVPTKVADRLPELTALIGD